jgi:hypothetical protein
MYDCGVPVVIDMVDDIDNNMLQVLLLDGYRVVASTVVIGLIIFLLY